MRETIDLLRSLTKEEAKEMVITGIYAILGFAIFIALLILAGGVEY